MFVITNISEVPLEHRCSPRGAYELQRQHVSLALGGVKDTGQWGGGHPFDVELVTLAPGKMNFPLHSHAAQTEHYIILSGVGVISGEDGTGRPLRAGDHVICHPGEAHQITCDATGPLVYYVISDHHRADVTTYPRTGKRHIKPEYRVILPQAADYYEGEE
jgi:uncharacterized cupin superfamily protein